MDTVVEIMVKKKKTAADYFLMAGLTVVASILIYILFFFVLPMKVFGSIAFMLIVGVAYLAYKLITSFNVEYEYSLVNDEVDIDKIIDRKRRKKLTTVKLRGIEAFGRCKNSKVLDGYMKNSGIKKIVACSAKNDEGVYYALCAEKEKRILVMFNPNEKIAETVKRLNLLKSGEFEL